MAIATILKHVRELNDTLVIAILPSGVQVSFRATSMTDALITLRRLSTQQDQTKDTDPVVDGPVELNIPAPKPLDPPTQAELDRAAFFVDYNKERTDQTLATLSPGLQSRYKPEYGRLI